VLIMWKDSFSKHGSYSNITLGIAPMIIMHFNCGSLNWFLKIFNTMVNRDTIYWRAFMSAYLKVNYFKGVSSRVNTNQPWNHNMPSYLFCSCA
jgi:hypothetical protein